jgi:dTDP-4-dehydrorhamnose 3,5-epimerase
VKVIKELLSGCFLLQPHKIEDHRGCFIKTYQKSLFNELGLDIEIREEFLSISNKNVLRGMHFQLPPHDHDKLVYCLRGAVLDVLLDLRVSKNYGQAAFTNLSADNVHLLYIPKGIAHGFLSLEDDTLMLYKTSTAHKPEYDFGIRWDSFGFNWDVAQPILSIRDEQHQPFCDFVSPF